MSIACRIDNAACTYRQYSTPPMACTHSLSLTHTYLPSLQGGVWKFIVEKKLVICFFLAYLVSYQCTIPNI